MRKLFGAFIAVFAILILPASALATPGEIRSGGVPATIGHTVKARSTDLVFTGEGGGLGGLTVECTHSEIFGEVTASDELSLTGGAFEPDPCATNHSPRVSVRVSPAISGSVRFEREGSNVRGTGSARFTLVAIDPGLGGVIGLCHYSGPVMTDSASGTDTLTVNGQATLEAGSAGACEPEGEVNGHVRLSRRDGTEVTID